MTKIPSVMTKPKAKNQRTSKQGDLIEDIKKDNLANLETIGKKMEKTEDTIVNTLKDAIKEALKDVAATIAEAVKEGINQKDDREDNLATQKIIKDIEIMNRRLDNEDRRSQPESGSLIFNPIPDPEPEPEKEKEKVKKEKKRSPRFIRLSRKTKCARRSIHS